MFRVCSSVWLSVELDDGLREDEMKKTKAVGDTLSGFPTVEQAIAVDGVIRVFDGRWSEGWVEMGELKTCMKLGLLKSEWRSGMEFAVRS